MSVDYQHSLNRHSLDGPRAALPRLFAAGRPASLLDVGCGTGTWLRAALDWGVTDVLGIDGVAIPPEELLIPRERFQQRNLEADWDLGRRFDAVLCLEVAEHLEPAAAGILVRALTRHADLVVFSAAIPGQPGQHHVHCRWPDYWQERFNEAGFACSDAVRWEIWDDTRIEPWYRQNLFVARREASTAGSETRLRAVVHPEVLERFKGAWRMDHFAQRTREVGNGSEPLPYYLSALRAKALRRFGRSASSPPR